MLHSHWVVKLLAVLQLEVFVIIHTIFFIIAFFISLALKNGDSLFSDEIDKILPLKDGELVLNHSHLFVTLVDHLLTVDE